MRNNPRRGTLPRDWKVGLKTETSVPAFLPSFPGLGSGSWHYNRCPSVCPVRRTVEITVVEVSWTRGTLPSSSSGLGRFAGRGRAGVLLESPSGVGAEETHASPPVSLVASLCARPCVPGLSSRPDPPPA